MKDFVEEVSRKDPDQILEMVETTRRESIVQIHKRASARQASSRITDLGYLEEVKTFKAGESPNRKL
jgi:hypothetical protein